MLHTYEFLICSSKNHSLIRLKRYNHIELDHFQQDSFFQIIVFYSFAK